MGVQNKRRRAAKAKDRQRRARERTARGPAAPDDLFDLGAATRARWVHETLMVALEAVDLETPTAPIPAVRAVAHACGKPDFAPLVDSALVMLVDVQVAKLWRRGWLPADVMRVLRRAKLDDLTVLMAADAMAAHLATFAASTVDERYTGQLTDLRADAGRWREAGFVPHWTRRAGADARAVVHSAVVLTGALIGLPSIGVLGPLPGELTRARAATAAGVDPKVLDRVRGLLAKAESSGFDAEADALTAKAQELMVRHSIDHALLSAVGPGTDEPGGLRIGVDPPYEAEKSMLLDRVARANRCQSIRAPHLGFVTVLGFPADLRAVEVLYTSLLVQSTRAMLREGSRPMAGGGNRTVAFRRSFQQAFAVRIGERLAGVADSTVREGAASDERLLPVLAGREHKVQQFVDAMFPDLVHETSVLGWDQEGWALGTHAADLAPLTAIPSLR